MGDEGIKECCGNAMGPGETGQLALPLGTTHVCRFISCTRFLPLWSIPSAVVPVPPRAWPCSRTPTPLPLLDPSPPVSPTLILYSILLLSPPLSCHSQTCGFSHVFRARSVVLSRTGAPCCHSIPIEFFCF